jgi:hypothetical protein
MKSISKIIKETKVEASFSTKWAKSKYLFLKQASTTETGTYGETLIVDLLKELEYDAEIVNNGKGDFDTLLNNLIKLENKTATMDTNGSFQFNSIKKGNIDYDFVFCLGVAYNKMYFEIVSKQFAETLTTQMTTHGGGYKYTSRPKRMKLLTYKNLKKEVSKIV